MQLTNYVFLLIFFPVVFFLYLLIKPKYKKIYLLTVSILFIMSYSLYDLVFLFILGIINYLISTKVYKNKKLLSLGIVLNASILLLKYIPFIVKNLYDFFSMIVIARNYDMYNYSIDDISKSLEIHSSKSISTTGWFLSIIKIQG